MKPKFFPSPSAWHAWLEEHHQKHEELWVGFYKVGSGKPSITWPEAVDGALCFGWIDGVRKSLDESRYVIRFTPRRPNSIWSAVNIKRVAELTSLNLMRPAGVQAFERRTGNRSESRGWAHSLAPRTKRSFAPTKRRGNTFRPNLRGIAGRPVGG
jgi:uncharacterized protein YdeI (YjbR/CyaY-like superfamily)